ncbi:hypothetical protein [Streptomyces sp. NPDC057702]|uniref:hypothetical protein n=1 Tax=unclassified Streptomyces TaxID=2593676 RepID=UPI0036A59778
MDAGPAAVLGAAVGSLTTLGAATVGGRMAARSPGDRWRREHRGDAYANCLSASHDRDIAMDAIVDALRPPGPDLRDVDEKAQRFVALAREVHRTAEVVATEGPSAVVKAADQVTRASADLSEAMRRMMRDAHTGDAWRKAADVVLAAERGHVLYESVKGVRSAAKDVRDSSGWPRPVRQDGEPGGRAQSERGTEATKPEATPHAARPAPHHPGRLTEPPRARQQPERTGQRHPGDRAGPPRARGRRARHERSGPDGRGRP